MTTVTHDDKDLIINHSTKLNSLEEKTETNETRLDNIEKDVQLMKGEMGIKDYRNGDRERRIKELQDRINEVGEKAEGEDKTLSDRLIRIETILENMEKDRQEEIQKKGVIESIRSNRLAMIVIYLTVIMLIFGMLAALYGYFGQNGKVVPNIPFL